MHPILITLSWLLPQEHWPKCQDAANKSEKSREILRQKKAQEDSLGKRVIFHCTRSRPERSRRIARSPDSSALLSTASRI